MSHAVYRHGEGCGNTFLVFPKQPKTSTTEVVALLNASKCDSALVVSELEENPDKVVATVDVVEKDHSISDFCGNGARVVARMLWTHRQDTKPCYFKSYLGLHRVHMPAEPNEDVGVTMGVTSFQCSPRFVNTDEFSEEDVRHCVKGVELHYTETLEPHIVVTDDISDDELIQLGEFLNNKRRDIFPKGVNVNRIRRIDHESIQVTTFERGVGSLTQACGTGSTSCASFVRKMGWTNTDTVYVRLAQGQLRITFNPKNNEANMYGPAQISE